MLDHFEETQRSRQERARNLGVVADMTPAGGQLMAAVESEGFGRQILLHCGEGSVLSGVGRASPIAHSHLVNYFNFYLD